MTSENAPPYFDYRVPRDLAVTPTTLRRVLVVGSCLLESYPAFIREEQPGCECDYILFNNATELPEPPHAPTDYDFQIVQLPIRTIFPEYVYFRPGYDDVEHHRRVQEEAVDRLRQLLASALKYNAESGLLTFVYNFMLPQQNPMGRLLPRHDPRNFVAFVDRLNVELSREVTSHRNAYVLDVDQISASCGRMYAQDDVLWQLNHGSVLADTDHPLDQQRIEPPRKASAYYSTHVYEFMKITWAETLGLFRTVRQIDAVKLVAVDLDDTLWRGLVVEEGTVTPNAYEGWPLGFIEALCFLKKRGILLAIVSKNDQRRVEAVWHEITLGRLEMEDFAVCKINWKPKVENIEEILHEVNVLPRSVVFIDDNPVERAAVQAAFPDMRVLGADLYYLRRVLLWSPETQVAQVSEESSRRNEMVQAQVQRETQRKRLSRGEFLATLDLKIDLRRIADTSDKSFPRALELINKSNQFNTTGRRWTHEECERFLAEGGSFYAFEVSDRFTRYGLVGVAIVHVQEIRQFVMSCRVVGLDVELAVISEIAGELHEGGMPLVTARITETEANAPCRDLFARSGFTQNSQGSWSKSLTEPTPLPAHVKLTWVE